VFGFSFIDKYLNHVFIPIGFKNFKDEDYLHYFMSCTYLKEFWVKIQQILKKSNIENFVTLKHIVSGYKIFDKDYFDFNNFLTILGFSIYKAYYVSGR
jgi:hypothetical protein